MNCVINDRIILSRAPEGPISDYICSFAEAAAAQGYAKNSVHRQVLIAACFSRWLGQREVGLQSITSDHPARYLRYRARRPRPGPGDAASLKHLVDFLRREGLIPPEEISAHRLTPIGRCAEARGPRAMR